MNVREFCPRQVFCDDLVVEDSRADRQLEPRGGVDHPGAVRDEDGGGGGEPRHGEVPRDRHRGGQHQRELSLVVRSCII